jgi:hypothetical protein
MAVSYTRVPDGNDVWGRQRQQYLDFLAPNGTTYPAGGFPLTALQFGLKFFNEVEIAGGDVSQGTYFAIFDYGTSFAGKRPTSAKLRLFTASGTELSGSVGASGFNARIAALGQ